MPYFDFFDEDQHAQSADPLLQQFGAAPGTKAGPVVSSRAPTEPASYAATASPSGVAGDSGSSFVNWERYQNANRDAALASANTVGNSVQGGAERAATGLSNLINTFNGQVDAGTGKGPTPGMTVQTAMGGVVNTVPGASNRTPAPGTPGSTNTSSGLPGVSAATTGLPGVANPPTATTDQPKTGTPAPFNSGTGDSRSAGTLSDPNAPASSSQGGAQPAGHLTRDDLVTGAGQTYRGPTSLAQTPGYDAVTGQVTSAAGQVSALGSKEGLGGLLAKNFGSGAVGSGVNELDSLLIGGAGRQRFGDIQKGYGDLEDRVTRAGATADQRVAQAQKTTTDAAGAYQSLLDEFDQKTAPKPGESTQTKKGPSKSFKDYNTGNEKAHTIRDIGRVLNPIGWLLNTAGFKSPEDYMTPQYEEQYGHPFGNSQAVQFDRAMPSASPQEQEAVYNGLSDEELAALEKMSPGEQRRFLDERLQALRGKGSLSSGTTIRNVNAGSK